MPCQKLALLFSVLGIVIGSCSGGIFAPFYDTFLDNRTTLTDIATKTGQKNFHLAFALGGVGFECVPTWGGTYAIDDAEILQHIKAVQALGGELIVATGGALGPYLEHACSTSETLAEAYKVVLNTVGTNHLDIDVETTVNFEIMNKALAIIQTERPEITVSFTLMVTGEDYGLTPQLGIDLLKNAVANGVRVDQVNAMAMEYPKISDDFGESVINVGVQVLLQMKEIWPEKTIADLKGMLGLTPMIGRNFNGNIFEISHAKKVVDWANLNEIGLLAFWSIERDNGRCAGASSPSAYCSGTTQDEYEFTKVFQDFTGTGPTVAF